MKELKKIIEHIQEYQFSSCDCEICEKQEYETFLDGIRFTIKILNK